MMKKVKSVLRFAKILHLSSGNYLCLCHTQIKHVHTAAFLAPASKVVTSHSGESKDIMGICKVHIKQTHMTTVSAQLSFNKRPY